MQRFYLSNRSLLIAVLIAATFCLALFFLLNRQIKSQVLAETAQLLSEQSSLRLGILERSIDENRRHVQFFHSVPSVQGIVRARSNRGVDPETTIPESEWRHRLQDLFGAYVESNPSIAQLRFIGFADQGKELVRVDRKDGLVKAIADVDLQSKGGRDYMVAARNLRPGELYISDINLNREFGEIEQPEWPTYRIALEVFDQEENLFGLVIANILAQPLLDNVVENLRSDMVFFLLNNDNQYLIHPQQENAFAFEHKPALSWAEEYSAANSPVIVAKTARVSPQFVKHSSRPIQYLYSERQYILQEKQPSRRLRLITAMENRNLAALSHQRQLIAAGIVGILFVVVLVLLLFYWRFSESSLAAIRAIAGFEALVQGSNDAIVSMNRYGLIETWNGAAEKMFGFFEKEVKGKRFFEVVSAAENAVALEKKFEQTLTGKIVPYFNIEVNTNIGNKTNVAITFSPIDDHSNSVVGVAAIMRDMTSEVDMQNRLKNFNQLLHRKNQEMEQFIYTVSHDLKSPLVTINGFVRSVMVSKENKLGEESERRLSRVMANVDHMGRLLGDLLELSRLIRKDIVMEACNIQACVDEACAAVEQLIQSENADIVVVDGISEIKANKTLLIQCLQNLIGNAIKYRDPHRPVSIQISCLRQDSEIHLSVRDNGLGIQAQYFDKVFQIFERLEVGEGTGVGLAIVKTAMEKHRGRVELQSEFGVGSTFTLVFPNH